MEEASEGEGAAAAPERKRTAEEVSEPVDDAPVEDLDAVIEDDLDGSEDLHELIAATVAGATAGDQAEDAPVETLDAEARRTEPVRSAEAEQAAFEPARASTEVGASADEESTPSAQEEPEEAIDLGDISSPDVRDRLLAQALAHAEKQDVRYRVPYSSPRRAGRWKGALASVLFLAASITALAPPAWVRPEPPARIGEARQVLDIRHALLLQAQQVDAYRVRLQRLPDTLDELPVSLADIRYVRSGNRAFQLIAYAPDGEAIVYDSSNPAPEFEQIEAGWSEGAAE